MIISEKHLVEVCEMGKIENCCRYLVMGSEGFECAKQPSLISTRRALDEKAQRGEMIAMGDNCEGMIGQGEAKEQSANPDILATVTDEEAARFQKGKEKALEARKFSKQALEMATSAQEEKSAWFAEVRKKYGITEGGITFDIETKTFRKIERSGGRCALSDVLGMLLGL